MLRFLLIVLAIPTLSHAQLDRFTGIWKGKGGVTTVKIRVSGETLRLHAFGKCGPPDCDWGEVNAQAYAPKVEANVQTSAKAITAEYEFGFANTLVVIKPGDTIDELRVEVFTVFKDSSGRSPIHHEHTVRRIP